MQRSIHHVFASHFDVYLASQFALLHGRELPSSVILNLSDVFATAFKRTLVFRKASSSNLDQTSQNGIPTFQAGFLATTSLHIHVTTAVPDPSNASSTTLGTPQKAVRPAMPYSGSAASTSPPTTN